MRQWTAGVTVVTTRVGSEVHGCTVNSFSSVSVAPPLVTFSLARDTHTYALIRQSGIFAVNILSQAQEDLSERFARHALSARERFDDEPYRFESTGSPVFERALAFADCRLHAEFPAGPNVILVGAVEAGGVLNPGSPLIYHNRRYRRLVP
jgi:flavin reductase (DIM6/NTAB) family NADH-FMN oxidoreductase RutF